MSATASMAFCLILSSVMVGTLSTTFCCEPIKQYRGMSNRKNWRTKSGVSGLHTWAISKLWKTEWRRGRERQRLCLRMPCNGYIQGDETKADAAGGFLYIKAQVCLPVCSWCWVTELPRGTVLVDTGCGCLFRQLCFYTFNFSSSFWRELYILYVWLMRDDSDLHHFCVDKWLIIPPRRRRLQEEVRNCQSVNPNSF